MMRVPPNMIAFLKFGGLSGIGWVMDACILLALVNLLGLPPFAANLISSSVAALSVFLLSRETIFKKAARGTGVRVTGYLLYTFVVICVASFGLQLIANWLAHTAYDRHVVLTVAELAAVAKVFVTPPQLLLNFMVSRFLSERTMEARPKAVHG